MRDNRHTVQKNTKRGPRDPMRRIGIGFAAALTGLVFLVGPSQASATEPAPTPLSHTQPAPAPELATPAAPSPTPPPPQPPPPASQPQTDTQPPGVSVYLPPEAIITLLTIITLLILGLRHGAAVARTCINALLRLFHPPGV